MTVRTEIRQTDVWTWAGGTVIFAATLFIATRERAGKPAAIVSRQAAE
jgi:hypothetical protein